MMLRHSVGLEQEATCIEAAVQKVLADGARTADLASPGEESLGTVAVADLVLAAL